MRGTAVKAIGTFAALILISGENEKASAPPPVKVEQAKETRVEELLKERLNALKALVKATKAAYAAGRGNFVDLVQATARLTSAELELCTTDMQRLVVLEQAFALASDYEKAAKQRFKAGQATEASVLAALANRLEAEIALERIRAKISAKPK